jgi:hypothetical protein
MKKEQKQKSKKVHLAGLMHFTLMASLLLPIPAQSAGLVPIAGDIIGKPAGIFDPDYTRVFCNPKLNQDLCYGPPASAGSKIATSWATYQNIEPLIVSGAPGSWSVFIGNSIEAESEKWSDSNVRNTNTLPSILTQNSTAYFPGNTTKDANGATVPAPSYMVDYRHMAQEKDGNYYPHPLTSFPAGVENPNMLQNTDYCPGFGPTSASPIKIADVGLCPSSIFEFGHRDANNNLLPIKQTLCKDMPTNVIAKGAKPRGPDFYCAATQVINYNPQGTCQRESSFTTMEYGLFWKTINRLPIDKRPYIMYYNALNGWVEWQAGLTGLMSGNKALNYPNDTKARFGAAVHRVGMRDTNTGLFFMLPNITEQANNDAIPGSKVPAATATKDMIASFANWDYFVNETGEIKPEYAYLLDNGALIKDLQFGSENYRTRLRFQGEFDGNYGSIPLKNGVMVSCGRNTCGSYQTQSGTTQFVANTCNSTTANINNCLNTGNSQCVYVPDLKVGTKTLRGCDAIKSAGTQNASLPVASRKKFFFPISSSLLNMSMMKYLGPETTGSAGELFGIYGARNTSPLQVRDAYIDYCVKPAKGNAVATLLKSNIYMSNWVRGINYCNDKTSFAAFLKAFPKVVNGRAGTIQDLQATMPAIVAQNANLGDHSLAKIGWIFNSSRTADDNDQYRAYWIIQNSSGPFAAEQGSNDVGIYFAPDYCMNGSAGKRSDQTWGSNPECYYPNGMAGTRNYRAGTSYTSLNTKSGQRLIIDYFTGNKQTSPVADIEDDSNFDPTQVLENDPLDDNDDQIVE